MSWTDPDESQQGATSTEYLFLMVFIALAIVVGALSYGGTLGQAFADGGDEVTDALSP